MPRIKCHNCDNKVTVRYSRLQQMGEPYIAFCYECYNAKEKPEGFRCLGYAHSGKRCNAWNDYNNGSKYCKNHKSQGDEKSE